MNNNNQSSFSDIAIWNAFRTGETQSFKLIYEHYIGLLTNYGLRITPDKELVKDAIHDLFVDLWNHRDRLNTTDSIQYYLMKAFRRNLVKKIQFERRRKGALEIKLDYQHFFEFSHELTLMKTELDAEMIKSLEHELNQLSARQKEVVYLRYYNGFTPEEIAQILEINPQSVYNHLHRGLSTLREKLNYSATNAVLLLFSALHDVY